MPQFKTRSKTGPVTFEHALIAIVAVIGFVAAAGPISGNTMLLHLRTGIDIFATGTIPRSDPYSFTAAGEPWVVQSWFAEWTYGALESVGGIRLVIFEQMILVMTITLMIALLARSGSMLRTALPCVVALAIGIPEWTARPALFGVACFALTVYIVDRHRSPWWLMPIGWIWVNTHGSFPLGIAWIAMTIFGAGLDKRLDKRHLRDWSKPLVLLCVGVLAGLVNPLGPKLFAFSLRVTGERGEVFGNIVEWASPDFHGAVGVTQLLAAGVAIVILINRHVPWRWAIPTVAFFVGALFSARNLGLLAIALVPALREALRSDAGAVRHLASPLSRMMVGAIACVLVLAVAATSIRLIDNEPLDLERYPVAALDWMDEAGLLDQPHRVAAQDTTGCYRIFRYGATQKVFIDDRYDMYPAEVSMDYLDLLRGTADPHEILDRYEIDVVLWAEHSPLSNALDGHSDWHRVYRDDDWLVLQRRSV